MGLVGLDDIAGAALAGLVELGEDESLRGAIGVVLDRGHGARHRDADLVVAVIQVDLVLERLAVVGLLVDL